MKMVGVECWGVHIIDVSVSGDAYTCTLVIDGKKEGDVTGIGAREVWFDRDSDKTRVELICAKGSIKDRCRAKAGDLIWMLVNCMRTRDLVSSVLRQRSFRIIGWDKAKVGKFTGSRPLKPDELKLALTDKESVVNEYEGVSIINYMDGKDAARFSFEMMGVNFGKLKPVFKGTLLDEGVFRASSDVAA